MSRLGLNLVLSAIFVLLKQMVDLTVAEQIVVWAMFCIGTLLHLGYKND